MGQFDGNERKCLLQVECNLLHRYASFITQLRNEAGFHEVFAFPLAGGQDDGVLGTSRCLPSGRTIRSAGGCATKHPVSFLFPSQLGQPSQVGPASNSGALSGGPVFPSITAVRSAKTTV
jgi:hypothetical protein